MNKVIWCLLFFGSYAIAAPNEQIKFQRVVSDNSIHYEYAWRDHANIEQSIQFTLDANLVAALPRQQSNYKHRIAMRYVTSELLKYAKTVDPRKARISIRQLGDNIDIGFRSQDPAAVEMLKAQMLEKKDSAYASYLLDHYYAEFTTPYGQDVVKPDHSRYVEAYTKALIPASQAFYEKLGEGTDARDYINLLLSWVQSIPYNVLEDRAQSNGSGFLPPIALLDSNQGDCDSKSVLVAAMVRAFLPTVPIRLVLLPNHALLGVVATQRDNDRIIDEDGLQMVLMEPTGPAPLAFGEIGESSSDFIARRLYALEVVP